MSGAMTPILLLVALMALGVLSSLVAVGWSHRYAPRSVGTAVQPADTEGQDEQETAELCAVRS